MVGGSNFVCLCFGLQFIFTLVHLCLLRFMIALHVTANTSVRDLVVLSLLLNCHMVFSAIIAVAFLHRLNTIACGAVPNMSEAALEEKRTKDPPRGTTPSRRQTSPPNAAAAVEQPRDVRRKEASAQGSVAAVFAVCHTTRHVPMREAQAPGENALILHTARMQTRQSNQRSLLHRCRRRQSKTTIKTRPPTKKRWKRSEQDDPIRRQSKTQTFPSVSKQRTT